MTRDYFVYRLYADDTLLYVGCTVDVARRLREHARDRLWWPEVTRHTVSEPMYRTDAVRAERSAIHVERPRYNTRHNPAPQPHVIPAARAAAMREAVDRLSVPTQGTDVA